MNGANYEKQLRLKAEAERDRYRAALEEIRAELFGGIGGEYHLADHIERKCARCIRTREALRGTTP